MNSNAISFELQKKHIIIITIISFKNTLNDKIHEIKTIHYKLVVT